MAKKTFIILNSIIFFLNISSSISILSFTYPSAISLKNGNIFVIHKYGVCVCNPSFSEVIKDIIIFSDGQQLSNEDDLSKVSLAQFEDGLIVSIIINKIYLFKINGDYENESDELINEGTNLYFSLSIDEIVENDRYYYLVGYIKDNSLYLRHFRYFLSTQTNEKFAYADNLKDSSYNSYNENFSILDKA